MRALVISAIVLVAMVLGMSSVVPALAYQVEPDVPPPPPPPPPSLECLECQDEFLEELDECLEDFVEEGDFEEFFECFFEAVEEFFECTEELVLRCEIPLGNG